MRRARSIAYALIAVSLIVAMYFWIESLGGPTAIRERFGMKGIVVSVITHWILNLTPLGEFVPMALANGAIWGFWVGALVSWVSYSHCLDSIDKAVSEFIVGRLLDQHPRAA